MRRREGVEPQIIALSGVIGETNGFERFLWDGRRQYLHAETGVTTEDGPLVRPQYSGKNSSQDIIIPLVRRLAGAGRGICAAKGMPTQPTSHDVLNSATPMSVASYDLATLHPTLSKPSWKVASRVF